MSMKEVVEHFKKLKQGKAIIDNQLNAIKIQGNYKTYNDQLKHIKVVLYNMMIENNITEFEGITLKSLSPAELKKAERKSKKINEINKILETVIELDESTNIIIDKLADL